MSVTRYMKQGALSPVLEKTLTDSAGNPINLTGASVTIKVVNYAGVVLINTAATIVSAVEGKVEYAWVDGDTAVANNYKYQFNATYADTTLEIFPDRRWELLVIERTL